MSALLALLVGCRTAPPDLVGGPALASLEPGARFWSRTCEIAVGTAAAEEALIDGWSTIEPDGDWRWATGRRSELWLDALGGEPLRLGFEAWAYPGALDRGAQRVGVALGGRELGSFELGAEPSEHVVEVPAGLAVAGHNRLVLSYSVAAPAPNGDPRVLSVGWRRLWIESTADAPARCGASAGRFESESLVLPLDSGVELFFDDPEPRWLTIESLTSRPPPGETPPAVDAAQPELQVIAEREGGAGPAEARLAIGERGFRLELPEGEGSARVALIARSGVGGPPGSSELVIAGASLASRSRPPGDRRETSRSAASTGSTSAAAAPPRPNVLIYLVDTLRADHLGCYGYERETSPRLDAFARQGVLFERAVAQSSWTRPTVATVLTGLDPLVHGVHRRGDRLSDELTTLPERLRDLGYATGAIVTNGNVSAPFGFDQGFDTFTYLPERASRGRHSRSRRVSEIAAAWLAERVERGESNPFFLYLHTTDPHAPYVPPPPLRARFLGADRGRAEARLGSLTQLRALEEGAELAPDALADLVSLYDAEVASNDQSFGLLLDRLEALGLARDTLVVFLADHGEELGDHGGWQHGRTLYQEQLHVPLVLRLPQGALAGSRRRDLVRQSDVVPTVLELVGAPAAGGLQGRALIPRAVLGGRPATSNPLAPAPAFAILDLDGNRAEAVLDGDHKLVHRLERAKGRSRRIDLFELAEDPSETVDRSPSEPVRLGHLEALLRSRRVLWPTATAAEQAEIDEQLADELRALGYVQ